jgi:hypothetical protein
MAKFVLRVEEGSVRRIARICLVDWHEAVGSGSGCEVLMSPNCRSFVEVSEQVDRLQGRLEAVRKQARRFFSTGSI